MAGQIGKDLSGKVAVITGASSGIGAASARLFAEAGARVVVGYNRGVERANAVVASLAGSGHKAMHLPLEDAAQIRKVAAAVREEFGRADILVRCEWPIDHLAMTALSRQVLAAASDAGYGREDFSALAKLLLDPTAHAEANDWLEQATRYLLSDRQ